jgi:hypothetical protein
MDALDPVILSRIQFAFVISFHIIFPAFTIGLAAWLVTIEGAHLRTGNPLYRRVLDFWLRVFAVSFGMGVVTGIVMAGRASWRRCACTARSTLFLQAVAARRGRRDGQMALSACSCAFDLLQPFQRSSTGKELK